MIAKYMIARQNQEKRGRKKRKEGKKEGRKRVKKKKKGIDYREESGIYEDKKEKKRNEGA